MSERMFVVFEVGGVEDNGVGGLVHTYNQNFKGVFSSLKKATKAADQLREEKKDPYHKSLIVEAYLDEIYKDTWREIVKNKKSSS